MSPRGRQTRLTQQQWYTASDVDDWKGNGTNRNINDLTTIAFQNIHGIDTRLSSMEQTLQELIESMDRNNINILGISEHHLALANHKVREKLHSTIKSRRPGTTTHQFNAGPESDTLGRLMGGTGVIVRNEMIGRIEPGGKGGDTMGQWSYVHLRRQGLPPLTVISVYQVCPTPTNMIGDTAWHQQRRYLDLHQRSEHPREAFIGDLHTFIQDLQRKAHAIVVGGDWNDWLTAKQTKLMTLCTSLHLVDPWVTKNPEVMDFAMFEGGRHRIDSAFVSQNIQDAVEVVQYSPVGLLCSTDHRAVIVRFDTRKLFGDLTVQLPKLHARSVRSNDRYATTTFIETMHAHLQEHNAFHRSQTLLTGTISNCNLAEQLDKLVGEGGDLGEKKSKRRRLNWFSRPLAQARQTVSLLRHYVNGLKVNVDRSRVIQQRLQYIDQTLALPTTTSEAIKLLQKHEEKLRKIIHRDDELRSAELKENAQKADAEGNGRKASANRKINKSEQNIRTWRCLIFMSSQGQTQQLNRIDVPESWQPNEEEDGHTPLEDPKTATRKMGRYQ